MWTLAKGRYQARLADGDADLEAALRLRTLAFRGPGAEGLDADDFDRACRHMLVEEAAGGRLVCCFRLLPLRSGAEIGRSYSAQFYELSALAHFDGPMVEMGRFCIHPDVHDPDILRVAWGAMTAWVDREGVEMLFGCSSFHGTEAREYYDACTPLFLVRDSAIKSHPSAGCRGSRPGCFRGFADRLRRIARLEAGRRQRCRRCCDSTC